MSYPYYVVVTDDKHHSEIYKIVNETFEDRLSDWVINNNYTMVNLVPKPGAVPYYPCKVLLHCPNGIVDDYVITILSEEHFMKLMDVFTAQCCEDNHCAITPMIPERRDEQNSSITYMG